MAKMCGIQVVPLDTIVTGDRGAMFFNCNKDMNETLKNRLKILNYNVNAIINSTEDINKYIIYVGSAHCDYSQEFGVAGISDVLNIPSVKCEDYNLYFRFDQERISEDAFSRTTLGIEENLISSIQQAVKGESSENKLEDYLPLSKQIANMQKFLNQLKADVFDKKWDTAGKSIIFFVKPWVPQGILDLRDKLTNVDQLKTDNAIINKFYDCLHTLDEANDRSGSFLGVKQTSDFYETKYDEARNIISKHQSAHKPK